MKKVLLTITLLSFASFAQAAENSKTKKPQTTIEETRPDRDHTVEADDVNVKREKTVYASSGNNTMNLRFDPLGLLVGIANAELDFKLSDKMTLGPSLAYLNYRILETTTTAYSLGIRANYYPGGGALSDDGWYVSPSVLYVSAKASAGTKSAEISGGALKVVGGYHWFWDSFNFMLGAGLVATSFPNKVTVKDSNNGTQEEVSISTGGTGGTLEAKIGFAF